ncbi:MAG: MgtC/SapB family protein [Gammaproteobacteria bacterium]|nr:MgtC/SapB family protein [Gammaproteobacteria bacterium]
MTDLILVKLLIAGAAGFIIGIERGWSARELGDRQDFAGMRTFALAGLGGGVCALLPGTTVLLAILVAAIAVLVIGSRFPGATAYRDTGLSTGLALIVTPLLGAFSTSHPLEGTAAAAIAAALLGFKQELHGALRGVERQELLASLQLLVVAVVVLPLLPDQALGPWDSVNPRTIGWLVLLLLGVSYLGYVAVRIVGPGRGLLLTALLGGFTSSTAVTLAYARLSKSNPDTMPLLSAGIALACAMMALRVAIVVGAIQPALLSGIALPLAVLGLVPLLYAAALARRSVTTRVGDSVRISNPFAIGAALVMATAITVLSMAVHGAEILLGNSGTYAVAALSGILDVDAVSVAMAGSAAAAEPADGIPGALSVAVASNGILLAVIVNTVAKALMTAATGTRDLGRRCGLVLVVAAAGAGLLALTG